MSSKNRLALAALPAATAALVALLVAAPAAPAEDLQSKLEDKEAKLSHVRERKGVLTTTISRYGARIEKLTSEVAALRTEEAAVRERLAAKQAELDGAVAELDVAKKHLAVVKARLKRALVALRERLVAMYETGTPDVLSLILELRRLRRTRRPAPSTWNGSTAWTKRSSAGSATCATRSSDTVARLRSRQEPDRSGPRRDRRRRAGAGRRPQGGPGAPVDAGRRPAPSGWTRSKRSTPPRKSSTATSPRSRANSPRPLAGYGSAPLPAGPIQPGNGSGLIWPVNGARRLRLRHALGADARGHRHRRAGRDADPRRRLGHRDPAPGRSRKRRLRQLHLPRPRRRAADLLRPPVGVRGQLRPERRRRAT